MITWADCPDRCANRRFRRVAGWMLVLVLARGVVYLCVLPPFEGWDEYQHLAYIQYLVENGRRPVLGESIVSPVLLEAAVRLPHPAEVVRTQLGRFGAVDSAAFWVQHDPRNHRQPPPRFHAEAPPIALYEAQHGPLYYRLVAPLFEALGGADDLRASVAGLRVLNVLLIVAAVGVTFLALRRAMFDARHAALAGLVLASHPLFLINGARVANDALGVLLATLAVALGLSLARASGARLVILSLLAGLAAGLAALAKASNFALAPFLLGAVGASWMRSGPTRGRAWLGGFLAVAGFALVTHDEIRSSLLRFGTLTPMQEAVVNARAGRGSADLFDTARAIPWVRLTERLWLRDLFYSGGWSVLRTHPEITRLYQSAATLALLGGVVGLAWRLARRDSTRAARFRSWWEPVGCALVVLSYTVALGYHRVQSTLAWGEASTGPWYACPALPWFLTLTVAAALGFPWPRRLDRLRFVLPAILAAAGLLAEPVATWGMMIPAYSGWAPDLEALARLALLRPAWLGTPTLLAALACEIVAVWTLVKTRSTLDSQQRDTRKSPHPTARSSVNWANTDRPTPT